jgi:hypothetical protein
MCRLKPRGPYSDRDSEMADETKNALPLLPDIQFLTRTERFKKSVCPERTPRFGIYKLPLSKTQYVTFFYKM